jgi:hypothetical protein
LDPHLGFTHDPETWINTGEDHGEAVFSIFGNPAQEDAVRIVCLGGERTDPARHGSWSQVLYHMLIDKGIKCVLYNGGVYGYSSNQEVIKLIRDALPLRPDLILSLNGQGDANPTNSCPEHPMVHSFQASLMNRVASKQESLFMPNFSQLLLGALQNMAGRENRVEKIDLGTPVESSPSDQWITNVRLMKTISESQGILYQCFLEPRIVDDGMKSYRGERDGDFFEHCQSRSGEMSYVTDLSGLLDDHEPPLDVPQTASTDRKISEAVISQIEGLLTIAEERARSRLVGKVQEGLER